MQRTLKWIKAPDDSLLIPQNPLLLTVCDESYFPYAYALAKSLEYFDKKSCICIHVVNPSPQLLNNLKVIATTSEYVFCSYEITDLSDLENEQRKTYYASARFLIICDLLKRISSSLLCLDSDSLIINPIDGDFNDNNDADIYLIRRDTKAKMVQHLKVATGTIYIRNSPGSGKFFNYLKEEFTKRFLTKNLPWFTDQIIFAEAMDHVKAAKVRNIKRKYADWEFSENSIVWAGKGERKALDLNFLILQNLLRNDNQSQSLLEKTTQLIGRSTLLKTNVYEKFKSVAVDHQKIALIILPRLDLPWKQPKNINNPPVVSMQTLELRSHWKKFTIQLSNALSVAGLKVEFLEIPAWEINDLIFDKTLADIIFIPHRCRNEFTRSAINRPAYFYMQEFFPWMFTVDINGWSAASSVYPVNHKELPDECPDKASQYKALLSAGKLISKFSQPDKKDISQLIKTGQLPASSDPRIPNKNFIFFPLQIPNDQSILHFSDLSEEEILDSLLSWSEKNEIPVVFKPHPANPKSMEPLVEKVRAKGGYIADANIHDLIGLATAVYTINSGVGFEALFHDKPIITFGRVEYDCCTFKASLENLDEAWTYCLESKPVDLEKQYAKFVNWFISEYAYDISDYEQSTTRLRLFAKRILKKHFPMRNIPDVDQN